MKIAYLGPNNSFTEQVARRIYPLGTEFVEIRPISKVVEAVESGFVENAIVPIENFYNGEVRETLDSLMGCKMTRIIREIHEDINLCLGKRKETIEIRKIYSKDQALEQSSKYLAENYPSVIINPVSSTSEACEIVRDDDGNCSAVIASKEAILSAGLELIEEDIRPENKTRFVVLGIVPVEASGKDKTFIAIHPPVRDKPGMLYNTLGFFAGLGVNLEYIQSRPDGRSGYIFYLELDGHIDDENIKRAIEVVRFSLDPDGLHNDVVKVLGSYPNTDWKESVSS